MIGDSQFLLLSVQEQGCGPWDCHVADLKQTRGSTFSHHLELTLKLISMGVCKAKTVTGLKKQLHSGRKT